MATPLQLCNLSLKTAGVLGVGQTAQAEDINDSFTILNYMLSAWQRQRWLIWHLVDLSVVSTGALNYSIGPAPADIVFAQRPDRIEGGFFRQLNTGPVNPVDYPLEIIESRTTYNLIALKNLTSFATYCFYDPAYPTGLLYPWPLMQSAIWEMHISVKTLLSQFTSLTQDINLPLEYEDAILYNLARRLRVAYRLGADPELNDLAKVALNTLRKANTQIGRLTMPNSLVRPGIYNPYSDQIR